MHTIGHTNQHPMAEGKLNSASEIQVAVRSLLVHKRARLQRMGVTKHLSAEERDQSEVENDLRRLILMMSKRRSATRTWLYV